MHTSHGHNLNVFLSLSLSLNTIESLFPEKSLPYPLLPRSSSSRSFSCNFSYVIVSTTPSTIANTNAPICSSLSLSGPGSCSCLCCISREECAEVGVGSLMRVREVRPTLRLMILEILL